MIRMFFPLVAVATMFVASSEANAFGLLNKMMGGGCCAAPTCCEATCGAAEASCGCAAAPTCAAPACEPTCGAQPSCCDSGCGTKCCRATPIRDLFASLHCRLHSLCHRNKCNSCCEATCGAAEATCGCAVEPACGCAK